MIMVEENNIKHIGKTLQLIRKKRGKTLQEFSHGIFSVAQLSRFENGKSDITLEHFMSLLKLNNVPYDKLMEKNLVKIEQDILREKINLSFKLGDGKDILKYYKRLPAHTDFDEKCEVAKTLLFVDVTLKVIYPNFRIPRHHLSWLELYFYNLEYWTLEDLEYLGFVYDYIPVETLVKITPSAIEAMNVLMAQKNFYAQKESVFISLLNVGFTLYEKDEKELAQTVYENCQAVYETHSFYLGTLMYLFYQKLIQIKLHHLPIEEIDENIDMFEFINPNICYQARIIANRYREENESWRNSEVVLSLVN
jgi:transcriptional regulator with XRE-family HTH domain